MQSIICYARMHRNEERIFLDCEKNSVINNVIKKQPGAKWSQTLKQWHLPMSESGYKQFSKAIEGIAIIDNAALKKYLTQKSNSKPNSQPLAPAVTATAQQPSAAKKTIVTTNTINSRIAGINSHVLPALKQQLVLKAYSPSTINTYMNEVTQFLQAIKMYAADEFTPLD